VSRVIPGYGSLILDVYRNEQLFGESSLLDLQSGPDVGIALEATEVMMWTVEEIRNLIRCRPQVGVALGQILAQRVIDFANRIESFVADQIDQRLARTLIHFGERLGDVAEDGSVHISGLKHELLSQYVGSSRATVTHWMNHFRRKGLLDYSRDMIRVSPLVLAGWLKQNPGDAEEITGRDPVTPRLNSETRPLSARETQIMDLIAEGLKNRGIAERLHIKEQTVKNHLQNIFQKLQAGNRRQAARRLALLRKPSRPPQMLPPPAYAPDWSRVAFSPGLAAGSGD
jgi:DNA-binding CsgD family transcriptional regulator